MLSIRNIFETSRAAHFPIETPHDIVTHYNFSGMREIGLNQSDVDYSAKRTFNLVLFWSLDRFTREGVRETLNDLQRLSASGVGWRSYQETYLDSCGVFKDVVISLTATLAKQERLRISERDQGWLTTR